MNVVEITTAKTPSRTATRRNAITFTSSAWRIWTMMTLSVWWKRPLLSNVPSIQSKAIAEEEETFNNDAENGGITITF